MKEGADVLNEEILHFLQQRRPGRHFAPGEIIFHQGEPAEEFYYLKSGLSLTYTIHDDGRERNILVSWPGRLFGASTFFEKHSRRASAIALRACEVIRIDRALCEECMQRFPEFSLYLMEELSKDIGVLFEQMTDSSLLTADVQVARFVCRRLVQGQYVGSEGQPVLDYTQDFIASVLGLSRWSVSMALSEFRRRGWLRTGHGKLTVLDAEALRRYGYGEE